VCAFFAVFVIFSFVTTFFGKLFAMALIVFHSVSCLSVVSGRDFIRLMYSLYAAILCSVGWLDV
jgi:hypothetical protein